MPEDFAIDSQRETSYTEVGDIESVEGVQAVKQAVFIAIYETVDMTPPAFEPDTIEEQRSAIETTVREHPYTVEPIAVTVISENTASEEITYQVQTNRIQFQTQTT